ncbi:MAG: DUF3089 domain-containing protein [Bacteroidota bacterium]|nr:DUF3089 domain-containing protein [Bacteroidota bacterium]
MNSTFNQASLFFLLSILFWSCASVPRGTFQPNSIPAPDYSLAEAWAALPTIKDNADVVPVDTWQDVQSTAAADVFFLHPTTYVGKHGQNKWNGDLRDAKLNERTDELPIRYQASIFNGSGKIYAPRYRQAHLNAYYTKRKKDAAQALELAYGDVKQAFQYYLDHYQQDRPFIIAAHSQGSAHAIRLIEDFIDGTSLQKKMIVAYLPGFPIDANHYKSMKPCIQPDDTGCFCSWRSVREGAMIDKMHYPDHEVVVTNPVTWSATNTTSSNSVHLGAILRDCQTLFPALVNTEVHEDFLWVTKPRFPWSFLLTTKNYHIADYNFFYADVRHNAQQRVQSYLSHP